MGASVRELLEKRAGFVSQARGIIDNADSEKRELTAEENQNFDRLMAEVNQIKARVDKETRLSALEAELGQSAGDPVHIAAGGEMRGEGPQAKEVMAKFDPFLRHFITKDHRMFSPEFRALQLDLDASGGYLRPPEQFVSDLVKAVDDQTFIRQWANVMSGVTAESLGVPTLEADPADADWTAELATGSEDSTMSFGKRSLTPKPLAKRIKVSRDLVRAVPSAVDFVRSRLAYKFGITFEKACLTGSGAGSPLGVFTASNDGISTSRDVSTGNAETSIAFDGLKEAKYTLKGNYWSRARWLFHRDALKQIAKLKDGESRYIWAESVRVGEPDRLLNLPVYMSEYAPNTFTTGLYVGILGDFTQYWIADSFNFELQVLNELYAETNQIGLIGRLKSDGMPVLQEAFVRVKLA